MKPKGKDETGQREAAIPSNIVLVCGLIILCSGILVLLFGNRSNAGYNYMNGWGLIIAGSAICVVPIFLLLLKAIRKGPS